MTFRPGWLGTVPSIDCADKCFSVAWVSFVSIDTADLSTTQPSELDFRTSFVESDGLTEMDQDGAEFARMLLAQAEQEQKDSEAEEAVAAAPVSPDEAVGVVSKLLQLSPVQLRADDGRTDRLMEPTNLAAEAIGPVTSKNRCRYYNKERTRCIRAATGLDGRCATHKISQFCKHPKCGKYSQGVGYCIKHGGGKKCKKEGCDKQVQGYGFCSGHGGKPLCSVDGCEKKRMEGG